MTTTGHLTKSTLALFVLFLNIIFTLATCTSDKLYVIRSIAPNGLVLDATDASQLKIQHYNDSPSQLWTFERGDRPGLFYIINSATQKVLDVKSDSNVFVNTRSNAFRQQWFLDSRGKITNAGQLKNIDIKRANFESGEHVLLYNENYDTNINQKFTLQEKFLENKI